MSMLGWFVAGWAICSAIGAVMAFIEIRGNGELTLGYFLGTVALVVIGPISLILLVLITMDKHKSTVIWSRRDKARPE